jgi:hypothetical protein
MDNQKKSNEDFHPLEISDRDALTESQQYEEHLFSESIIRSEKQSSDILFSQSDRLTRVILLCQPWSSAVNLNLSLLGLDSCRGSISGLNSIHYLHLRISKGE